MDREDKYAYIDLTIGIEIAVLNSSLEKAKYPSRIARRIRHLRKALNYLKELGGWTK